MERHHGNFMDHFNKADGSKKRMMMGASCNVRRNDALLVLAVTFGAGCWAGHRLASCAAAAPPPPPRAPWEERGPPSKEELGQAGWTLLHTIAANFPDAPTPRQRGRMEMFLQTLGDFYPCEVCASHFRKHATTNPIAAGSRRELSLWLCEAHNEVNKRNGKDHYYCDLGVLDARWKDCGCGHAKNGTQAPAAPSRLLSPHARRRKRAAGGWFGKSPSETRARR